MKRPAALFKKNYALAKHHAWAGSILLAILLAIRVFFESRNREINDTLFLIIGFAIMIYILIALMFTYRYRSALIDKKTGDNYDSTTKTLAEKQLQTDLEKQRLKLEKKKAKSEAKAQKKQQKEQQKQLKKTNEKNL